jgi:hypothetical protein
LDTFGQSTTPPTNMNFIHVAGGGHHSLGLRSNGTVTAWGRNNTGQLDVPSPNSNFIAIAGGGQHSAGLKSDGTIVAWGLNTGGQTNVPAPNIGFVSVAAGWNFCLGLKTNGSIVAWGSDSHGQVTVPATNSGYIAIAGGGYHSLGLKSNGTIVAWGRNTEGQSTLPATNSNFVAIAAGILHSLALKADGAVVAWGDNSFNQLSLPTPNENFVAIAANGYHSMALRADGSIVVWGRNSDGQTNVPPPNSNLGIRSPAASPSSGPLTGGYTVTVSGYFLNGDITNVTLAGISASSILSQSSSQIIVIAGSAPSPALGNIHAYSTGSGLLILSNSFQYVGSQTITFPPISNQLTTNQVGLSAISSSGLPVAFNVVGGPAILSGGTNLSFNASGTVVVVASQPGNASWYQAPSVTNTFVVNKSTATINLENLNQAYDGTPRLVTASTTPEGLPVNISYNGSGTAPTAAGSYPVTGVINDVIYQGQATGLLVVAKASSTITISNTFAIYDGFAKPVTIHTTPTGLPIVVTYAGNPWAPTNVGTYSVTATVTDPNYVGSNTALLTIAKSDQLITFNAIGDQIASNTVHLSATASSSLPVTFSVVSGYASISGGTNMIFSGAGLVQVKATQAGDSNWNPAADVTNSFNVTMADQYITYTMLSTQLLTNVVHLSATASSGLPVSFDVSSGPAVLNNGTNLTFSGTGVVSLIVYQSGNNVWNEAPYLVNTFDVVWPYYYLTISADANGAVNYLSGWLPADEVINIYAVPYSYYHFTNWTGSVSGPSMYSNPLPLLMNGPKTIVAHFAEDTTSNGVPINWLVNNGFSNNYDLVVYEDPDVDHVITGDEYIMDTDPNNALSYLAVESLKRVSPSSTNLVMTAPVSTNRMYSWEFTTNLKTSAWQSVEGQTNIVPPGTTLTLTNTSDSASGPLTFRLRVQKP